MEELPEKKNWIKEIKSIVLIVVLVFAFRSSFFEPFRIPSGSMIPTLMIGDFILVNKFSYGIRLPFSGSTVGMLGIDWGPIYLFGKKYPKRGDVIVFKYPKDRTLDYIKRVVAVPGDELEIVDKIVYVNGKPYDHQQIDGREIMADMDDKFKNELFNFYQYQTGEHKHIVQKLDRPGYIDNVPPRTVPEGYYFVMGDNRDFSADSRYWGFVPYENIKGQAMFVWFSMIFPFGGDQFKFRPYRIGTIID